MLRLARERDKLTVIDDQFGAPTGAELLADITAHAIRATLQDPSKAGLYHAIAGGETTWHGYARYVLELAQQAGVELKAGPQQVEAVPTSAFPTPATRPHNSRLEALGDAVLSVVASHHAFAAFPWGDEGVLSDARCGVIGTKLFALFSLQLGLPALLHHGDRPSP